MTKVTYSCSSLSVQVLSNICSHGTVTSHARAVAATTAGTAMAVPVFVGTKKKKFILHAAAHESFSVVKPGFFLLPTALHAACCDVTRCHYDTPYSKRIC